MGFTEFKNDLSLKVDQNKPEIMLVAGLIGVIGATVLACRATIKAKDIVEECNEKVDELYGRVNGIIEDETGIVDEVELPVEQKKEVRKVYLKTGLKLAKVYAPAVAVETAAFALIFKSNSVQRDRLTGLTAAYMAVDQAYKKYRQAVIDELGEEKDLEFQGFKKEKIVETYTDEDGNEKTEETELYSKTELGAYEAIFDESCPDWKKAPDHNYHFLLLQQAQANEKLRIQGHLFLNEVYDMIGIPRTKEGAVCGWLWRDPDSTNLKLNGFVDFGINDFKNEKYPGEAGRKYAFATGEERNILLRFNCDGVIYPYI